jgi:broad specificity phosphatase PhoE
MTRVYFITHPDVIIDPAVPIPQWGLSPLGRQRAHALLAQPWIPDLGAVWCSTERKAIETAEIVANAINTAPLYFADLGENDRSATGYLPKAEFEATADMFFANPHASVRGWEPSANAQRRIMAAVSHILAETAPGRAVALVSHGGVGTLFLCHLKRCGISRSEDQPGGGGGNYYCFNRADYSLLHGWRAIEDLTL